MSPPNAELIHATCVAIGGISLLLTGIGFTASYIIWAVYFKAPSDTYWCFGIGPQGIGVVGMFLNFTITLLLTPLCPPPTKSRPPAP